LLCVHGGGCKQPRSPQPAKAPLPHSTLHTPPRSRTHLACARAHTRTHTHTRCEQVYYTVTGFVEKNRDAVPSALADLMLDGSDG
jgi:hypothetical protein